MYPTNTVKVYEKLSDRWELGVCVSSNDKFDQISFVNGISTPNGGVHVEVITKLITSGVVKYIKKKKSETEERLDITSDEFGRFLFALVHSQPKQKKRNNDTARDLILMAIMTGSRDTELKNLKWSWFDSTTSFGSYTAPARDNEKNFEGTKGKRDWITSW